MFNAELRGDRELIERIDGLPEALQRALYIKVTDLSLRLEKYVKTQKLNGQVLNRRTGALARSINHRVEAIQNAVYGYVFSSGDVKYAAIHEFGGKTPAHIIEPKSGKALAFMMGGKQAFFRRVHHPGSQMPERSFLRSSLSDMAEEITTGIKETALQAVRDRMSGRG